ncbi:hypothetical protein M9Y10_002213 [Tritrichomonas musculus]|uniref:Uncharacterized protein n=1 Tax=Tritrichomonas musculus TaxID=1915356 RepID=A0ABR2L965_9EUKA
MQLRTLKLSCAIAIMYIGFLLYFMLHEELIPKKNQSEDSFNFPNFLLFFNDVCYLIAAFIAILVTRAKLPSNPFPYMLIAIPQQIGLACSNYAPKYIDYPTYQVMKSAKPLSVMLCQILIFRQSISQKKIFVVILLSIGLIIFGMNGNFGKSSYIGIILACGALFSDAMYVPMVDKLKTKGGPFVTMFYNFMWSSLIVFLIQFMEIYRAIIWIMDHRFILPKLIAFGLTGSIAQVALFAAIGMSDGLVVAIATTTRKLFTIVLSSIVFRHNLNVRQWIGVAIVFIALGIEILFKTKKQKVDPNPENNKNDVKK